MPPGLKAGGFGYMFAEAMRLGRDLLDELRLHREEMERWRRDRGSSKDYGDE
jgi:hypothetical protein